MLNHIIPVSFCEYFTRNSRNLAFCWTLCQPVCLLNPSTLNFFNINLINTLRPDNVCAFDTFLNIFFLNLNIVLIPINFIRIRIFITHIINYGIILLNTIYKKKNKVIVISIQFIFFVSGIRAYRDVIVYFTKHTSSLF